MQISKASHPCTWGVCMDVLYDNGAVNRQEPEPVTLTLPYYGNPKDFDGIEKALGALSEERRQTLAFGESTDAMDVVGDDVHLILFNLVLNKWFEDGLRR